MRLDAPSTIWQDTDDPVVLSFLFHRWFVSGSDAGLPLPCASDSVVLLLVCRQTNMLAGGYCGRRGWWIIVVWRWRWRCASGRCACWCPAAPGTSWSETSCGRRRCATRKPQDRSAQPFITHLFSRGFRGFSLADPSVYVYSWLSNSGYSTCIIWRMNKKPYLEDDKEIKVVQ